MYRKEVNEHSPIRILEKSIHGGLGAGNLGVVMARAGVGKTACLVQIGLDDLLREKAVLHVAVDQTMDHVQSWYDALFEDLAITNDLEEVEAVRQTVQKHRIIATFTDHNLWPDRLQTTVESFEKALGFRPAAILVDGYPWDAHPTAKNAAMIGAFRTYAKMLGAELWMSAQTHRNTTGDHPTALMPPWSEYEELIDVAIFLEPHGDDVSVRLLKDHGDAVPPNTHLQLHPDTLRLVIEDEEPRSRSLHNSAFTLLSGGAKGAEAEFGACSEAWGLTELNFSFSGRTPVRDRGLVSLSEQELNQGAVSSVYLETHMKRTFPDTRIFQRTLQSIWHQVNTAGEVFAIGWILEDKTVKGGTGWAAELGRHWHKPVTVYDQDKNSWFRWSTEANDWLPVKDPVIRHRRFAGTGTRNLSDDAKTAIAGLFERSFGARPSWNPASDVQN